MNENHVGNQGKKAAVTVKKVMRLLSFLCIVLFFCPTFLVSCSGKDVNVSAMTAVKGVSMYGEKVADPHPVMLICLLLPMAVLVLLFVKKFSDQKTAGIAAACGAVDFIIWLIFRAAVKKIANENYCSFQTTAWYVLNLAALLFIIIFSVLIILKKIEMEMDLAAPFAISKVQGNLTQMSNAGGNLADRQRKESVTEFCQACGSPVGSADDVQGVKMEVEPKAKKGQPERQVKPVPIKALAGLCVAVAALIVIICVAVNSGSTINLNDYLTIESEGYDGYGTARASIDWDAVEEKYGEKLSFTDKAKSEYGILINATDPIEALKGFVRVQLNVSDGLSNGDKITYTWDLEEELSTYIKGKIKYEDGSYGVYGLIEVGTFDAFADLELTFSGIGPDGNVEINYKGTNLSASDFDCDKDSGLSNGDTVKVTIDNDKLEYYAQNLGMVPETLEKEYVVEGLSNYISKRSEISMEGLKSMQQQASDVYHAHVAQNWSDNETLESFSYIGNYLLTKKDPDSYWGNQNVLYLVYKVQVRNMYSNGEDTFDKVSDVYWYCSFDSLMTDPDGILTVDLADYSTPSARFTVDSGISYGWFGTRTWYYYGYETLDLLYKDVVTSNVDSYNHEDNVDESASLATAAEDENEGLKTGYVLPDSNTKLLSEKDLEGLSDEECKIARNEIYARHGRKFKDENLQAYFDACDWYEGTIEPDDFEESSLSDIEIANRDLIVAYEKKMQ